MNIAVRLMKTGGPDVLTLEQVASEDPGVGQVWLEQESIGVNYLDITQRNGAVPIALPSGLGLEAAGRVITVGPDVLHVTPGDRVAYILGPLGAYASGRLYPADRLILLPADLSADDASTVLFKGITAHYLLHSTYNVGPGTVVLLYGAAGALGTIMAPWAKALGAFVIGVVSKPTSVERAQRAGCDAVRVWGTCDLAAEVRALTAGDMAHVVYDGVGKPTFAVSLDCLRRRGMMVSIGASAGFPDPIAVGLLNAKGSLYLTRPGLGDHAREIDEYRGRAAAVFDAVRKGLITPTAWKTFSLSDVSVAHTEIEEGRAAGAILLRP